MPKKVEFEDKMHRLEEISEKLNGNSQNLNESIKLYEEGMKLIKQLNNELNRAEEKIKILSGQDGIDLVDFE